MGSFPSGVSLIKKKTLESIHSSFSSRSPDRSSPHGVDRNIVPPNDEPGNVGRRRMKEYFSYTRTMSGNDEDEEVEAEEGYESGLESELQIWEQHKKEFEKRCKQEADKFIHRKSLDDELDDAWKENVFVPRSWEGREWSYPHSKQRSRPSIECPLFCVHGVNTENLRDSVDFIWESEIFWTCGSIVVLYNFRTHKYNFLKKHDHEIVATAYLPQKGLLATAQGGMSPKIIVWDVKKGCMVSKLRDVGTASANGTNNFSTQHYSSNDYRQHRRYYQAQNSSNLKNNVIRGVTTCMDFTPDGSYLVTVVENDGGEIHVCVMDWKLGYVEIRSHQPLPKLLQVRCNPYCPSDRFVTVGKKHCGFWRIHYPSRITSAEAINFSCHDPSNNNTGEGGKSLTYSPGFFRKQAGLKRTMVSITFLRKYTVTGSVSGEIYIWDDVVLFRVIDAHHGPVNCLRNYNNGVISGGKDGYLHIYNKRFMRKEIINFNRVKYTVNAFNFNGVGGTGDSKSSTPAEVGKNKDVSSTSSSSSSSSSRFGGRRRNKIDIPRNSVKSLRILHSKALVATVTNSIYEIGLKSKRIHMIARNHFNEISSLHTRMNNSSAIDCHPTRSGIFCTVSSDRTLRVWNFSDLVEICETDASPSCLSYSPSGNLIAVGTNFGCISIFESGSLVELIKRKDRCEAIRQIKFSPNGRYLASVSTRSVDIYDIKMNFSLIGICRVKDNRLGSTVSTSPQYAQACQSLQPGEVGRTSSHPNRPPSRRGKRPPIMNHHLPTSTSVVGRKKQSRICSVDWSFNSKFVRVNCLYPSKRIIYFEIGEKRIRTIVNKVDLLFGDERIDYRYWYTNTCPLSFGCFGVLEDLNLRVGKRRRRKNSTHNNNNPNNNEDEYDEEYDEVVDDDDDDDEDEGMHSFYDREFLQLTSDGKFLFSRNENYIRVYKYPVMMTSSSTSKSTTSNKRKNKKRKSKKKKKMKKKKKNVKKKKVKKKIKKKVKKKRDRKNSKSEEIIKIQNEEKNEGGEEEEEEGEVTEEEEEEEEEEESCSSEESFESTEEEEEEGDEFLSFCDSSSTSTNSDSEEEDVVTSDNEIDSEEEEDEDDDDDEFSTSTTDDDEEEYPKRKKNLFFRRKKKNNKKKKKKKRSRMKNLRNFMTSDKNDHDHLEHLKRKNRSRRSSNRRRRRKRKRNRKKRKRYVEFCDHSAEITVFKIDSKNNHLYSIDIDNNVIIRKILY